MTFTGPDEVVRLFDAQDYLLDTGTASAIFLAVTLGRPLLLEGEPGVGKTTAAKALAGVLNTSLVRLQCYEGLTAARRSMTGTINVSCSPSGLPRRAAPGSPKATCTPRRTC